MALAERSVDRRTFLTASSVLAATMVLKPSSASAMLPRVVAFDGYTVFDPTTAVSVAERILPGRGKGFIAAWRSRMFEYQWLRTLGARYVDFEQTAADSLDYVLANGFGPVSSGDRQQLLDAQLTLIPWPDAAGALARLRAGGIRLMLLSNMTEAMLERGVRSAGIRAAFDAILTTDRVRAAKPDLRAYAMGPDVSGCPPSEMAFVAFAPWDAAGASWYGYRTIWMNAAGAPPERLDASPALVCHTLSEAATLVLSLS